MKYKFFTCSIFLFFALMLFFPKEALAGSSDGLLLWFHTVLPTLLPFLILTNFIIQLDAVHILCCFFTPIFGKIFHLTAYGCYALLTGLLCGYPMGAKVTADLVRENKMSLSEGTYLLGISNNASPMFFLGYVIHQSLNCPQHTLALVSILYGTPLLYALLTRPKTEYELVHSTGNSSKKRHLSFAVVDKSIMNGFETITRLGGYIILFAIIAKMVTACFSTVTILQHFLIGFIEITNGIHAVGSSAMPLIWKIPLTMAITSFGGLSGLAQTRSMLSETSLSITGYFVTKVKITLLSLLFSVLYCYLFVA